MQNPSALTKISKRVQLNPAIYRCFQLAIGVFYDGLLGSLKQFSQYRS